MFFTTIHYENNQNPLTKLPSCTLTLCLGYHALALFLFVNMYSLNLHNSL
nr:MAG TPA: hypothetical protein [Crassvirales sp.]